MGFLDELKKLTQPYDDEDDTYEGADVARREEPAVTPAQLAFEDTFAAEPEEAPEPAEAAEPASASPRRAGLLDALGLLKKPAGP
ncbi:MAG: hypothetical protein K6G17_09760, partial [Oscillospiraceae bacterium]|nr:hypothetical protein [Oscillospiraceae bacterium]